MKLTRHFLILTGSNCLSVSEEILYCVTSHSVSEEILCCVTSHSEKWERDTCIHNMRKHVGCTEFRVKPTGTESCDCWLCVCVSVCVCMHMHMSRHVQSWLDFHYSLQKVAICMGEAGQPGLLCMWGSSGSLKEQLCAAFSCHPV